MIRNAVLHIMNEQPLLADLFATPTPSDVSLVCTNLRTMSGTRPIFVDRTESLFLFPLAHIRFVEVPSPAAARDADDGSEARVPVGSSRPAPAEEPELELDEDLLRRVREL